MDEYHATLLSEVGLFGLLPREKLQRFAQGIPFKGFGVGEHVFTPAYGGEVFFLLLEGRVRIYRLEAGREVTIGILEAGEMFGEAAFTPREGTGAYAQVIAPSEIAFLNRSTFYGLVLREPEVGIRAVELLSERLAFYEQRIADLSLKKVPARLASLILQLVGQDGVVTGESGYRIRNRYSHEELATMIGAKRVAVTRAMKELREAGAVGLTGRHIVVENAEALERIAEDVARRLSRPAPDQRSFLAEQWI